MDWQIAEWCQQNSLAHPWLVTAARNVTQVGSLPTIAAVTLLGMFFLAHMGKKKAALFWFIAIASGVGAGLTIKHFVERARPPAEMQESCVEAEGSSFPSGHALAITITALALGNVCGGLGLSRMTSAVVILILVVLVLAVGASRFYLRVHWFSDVVAGWLIGAAWFVGVSEFHKFIGRD